MKKDIKQAGEISVRLEMFVAQLEELKFFPNQEKLAEMRKEVLAYAGTPQFSKHAMRGHKETVGTLLIDILELEDILNK